MKVLVIVDMQKDFIDGALGSKEAQEMVPVMEKKLKEYDSEDTLVILTKDTHYDNYLETMEGKYLHVPHCIKGTPGWDIDKRIATIVDNGKFKKVFSDTISDSRIEKPTFGSFQLIEVIEEAIRFEEFDDIEEIVFMGLCTDICVVSNALLCKAAFPEINISVEATCCAGVTPQSHQAALLTMEMCQINIIGE